MCRGVGVIKKLPCKTSHIGAINEFPCSAYCGIFMPRNYDIPDAILLRTARKI